MSNLYTVTRDVPGKRPVKHYLPKEKAFKLAREYLLCRGMVTICDPDGKEVYRHAQPWMRQQREGLCLT